MIAPQKLHFLSDYSIAELVGRYKGSKPADEIYEYRYVKAFENNGKSFPIALKQIEKLISDHLLTIE